MNENFSSERYEDMLQRLFVRFPSFQKVGAGAYKPGIANMEFVDQLLGHPHRKYEIIHIAGTNGKGSVSNMLASVLAASGKKVGLYTSPHITDFRERMRVVEEGQGVRMIAPEEVWDFVQTWHETFDHLDMSFFEITTMMALDWFAKMQVDMVVLETGLGGRLDSTNVVTPILSVITNIGLDHCDMLGETLPEIAFEKAGIIKPRVPVVVGESHLETSDVFERKVLYTNLPEVEYMGDRKRIMSLLTYADKVEPSLWDKSGEILAKMDLQGEYQRKNLRTALACLDVLGCTASSETIADALVNTASRTDFHGRWEKLSDTPYIICDIGHNEHGLRYNFSQLEKMKAEGRCSDLVIVYGTVADKDVDAVIHLLPSEAVYVFTQASGRRALPAESVRDKYLAYCKESGHKPCEVHCCATVSEAVAKAKAIAASLSDPSCADSLSDSPYAGSPSGSPYAGSPDARPLIYIGGSTYVVSEAVALG